MAQETSKDALNGAEDEPPSTVDNQLDEAKKSIGRGDDETLTSYDQVEDLIKKEIEAAPLSDVIGNASGVMGTLISKFPQFAQQIQETVTVFRNKALKDVEIDNKEAAQKLANMEKAATAAGDRYTNSGYKDDAAMHAKHSINGYKGGNTSTDFSSTEATPTATAAPAPSYNAAPSTTYIQSDSIQEGMESGHNNGGDIRFKENGKDQKTKESTSFLSELEEATGEKDQADEKGVEATQDAEKTQPAEENSVEKPLTIDPVKVQETDPARIEALEKQETIKDEIKPEDTSTGSEEPESEAEKKVASVQQSTPGITQNNSENKEKKGLGKFLSKVFGKKDRAENDETTKDLDATSGENKEAEEIAPEKEEIGGQSLANHFSLTAQKNQEQSFEVPKMDDNIIQNMQTNEMQAFKE